VWCGFIIRSSDSRARR